VKASREFETPRLVYRLSYEMYGTIHFAAHKSAFEKRYIEHEKNRKQARGMRTRESEHLKATITALLTTSDASLSPVRNKFERALPSTNAQGAVSWAKQQKPNHQFLSKTPSRQRA
jgi:predicted DsbA family dithiol-disulfide isomerase